MLSRQKKSKTEPGSDFLNWWLFLITYIRIVYFLAQKKEPGSVLDQIPFTDTYDK